MTEPTEPTMPAESREPALPTEGDPIGQSAESREPATLGEPATPGRSAGRRRRRPRRRTTADGAAAPEPTRPVALRLARLHLRTGGHAIARAELETLAGSGGLDLDGLVDLAEVRWRTDDLAGAGEAAAAVLASGHEPLVVLVIAAEATAALGRPTEARRLAGRALESGGSLDAMFAGIARSAVWPRDTATDSVSAVAPPSGTPAPQSAGIRARQPVAMGPGPALIPTDPSGDPAAQLASARAALAAGDRDGAAIRLAVVLRLSPALAPAVLDVAAAEPGAAFDLVRGDALRLVGHETQARRSFAAAAARVGSDREPDPGP